MGYNISQWHQHAGHDVESTAVEEETKAANLELRNALSQFISKTERLIKD